MSHSIMKRLSRLVGQAGGALDRCIGIVAPKPANQVNPDDSANYLTGSQDIPDPASVPHDTIYVQDVSGSMSIKDCRPSRLGAGKKAVESHARKRASLSPQDRVGLVAFTTSATVILPLTDISDTRSIIKGLGKLRAKGGTDMSCGLKAADGMFAADVMPSAQLSRLRRVLLLTDGHGGSPLRIATRLKSRGVLVEVIGFGGDPSEVNEKVLRRVATTDSDGFVHYWFFQDTESLVAHYEDLATGIVFRRCGR